MPQPIIRKAGSNNAQLVTINIHIYGSVNPCAVEIYGNMEKIIRILTINHGKI